MDELKRSELTFLDGFIARQPYSEGDRVFDWDKAAEIINKAYSEHPDLIAEAGLQGDWNFTGGCIFENGQPVKDSYTYLESSWATPTIILSWEGRDQIELECWELADGSRFNSGSKWDKKSLGILGI